MAEKRQTFILLYFNGDNPQIAYLFHDDELYHPFVRNKFNNVLTSSGFRPINANESVMDYWKDFEENYVGALLSYTEIGATEYAKLLLKLRTAGMNPDLFDPEDEYFMMMEPVIMIQP